MIVKSFTSSVAENEKNEETIFHHRVVEFDLDVLLSDLDSMTINPHYPFNEVVEMDIDSLISGAFTKHSGVVHQKSKNPRITSELLGDAIPINLYLKEETSVESSVTDFKSRNSPPAVHVSERLDDSNGSSTLTLVHQKDKNSHENKMFLSPQISLKTENSQATKTLSSDREESDSDLANYSCLNSVELAGQKLISVTSTTERIYEEIRETLNHQEYHKPTIFLKDCSELGMILKPTLSDKKVTEKCYEKIKSPIRPFDFSRPSPDAYACQRRLGTNIPMGRSEPHRILYLKSKRRNK
ncbi:hypothetical protein QYM36_018241 [Artemia franciscana]|uniref:Uncharacterized protein n=1 Tax=Artemia franciscana TaxID=6661 RepID=A0AA88H2N1_ARTSF|nr:hypothetical protein QYM36_018241 [Artemia franciscana]